MIAVHGKSKTEEFPADTPNMILAEEIEQESLAWDLGWEWPSFG